ncbi:hypothetical protein QL285_055679 [Trifolium repens]|nr:hypothetical protein QL285_055679 [Trifolium repens]
MIILFIIDCLSVFIIPISVNTIICSSISLKMWRIAILFPTIFNIVIGLSTECAEFITSTTTTSSSTTSTRASTTIRTTSTSISIITRNC